MVLIYEEINTIQGALFLYPSTDKLICFIDTYGIDYIDEKNKSLLFYLDRMSEEQIDVIFDKKPDITKLTFDICAKVGQLKQHLALYILSRILDNDDHFMVVTTKCKKYPHPLYRAIFGKCGKNLLGMLRHADQQHDGMVLDLKFKSKIEKAIVMLENHEKRYYKLFDLMKYRIE